jgi:isopentenyl diphosphate isomerase/L-lactate dehydrogenase-like FMN-dependent dehydrogenase
VLGTSISLPVILAPCGFVRVFHPDGDIGVATAAHEEGVISCLSTASITPLEEVARAPGAKWFQLYSLGGRRGSEVLIERARDSGYEVLVVTVDTPVPGNRLRESHGGLGRRMKFDREAILYYAPWVAIRPRWLYHFARDGFPLGWGNADDLIARGMVGSVAEAFAGLTETPHWEDFAWIKERFGGPVAVKGVLTAVDARRAVDAGVDAVIVSNHGGRQLDGDPATVRVLPEIVDAVGGQTEILVDGGVRRGADIARAVALGARAVLIGRPYIYGLAAAGTGGVHRVIGILRDELTRTMQLLGCPSIKELDASWVSTPAGGLGVARS